MSTLRAENAEALRIASGLRTAASALRDRPEQLGEVRDLLGRLAEIDRHFLREEHQVFPFIEMRASAAASSAAWEQHDGIREQIRDARRAAASDDAATLEEIACVLAASVEEAVLADERELLPVALDLLTEEEWAQVRKGESAVGYAWVPDPPAWPAPPATSPANGHSSASDLVPLTTGTLSAAQIDLMLCALPVDVTFVDQDDRVRYYSGGERVFRRAPGVIGRRVQACHPAASVDRVQAILDAFRSGVRDSAEFWIDLGGRFVHIRYFALRDPSGEYQGCLEVTQDATEVRALSGERRLLDEA